MRVLAAIGLLLLAGCASPASDVPPTVGEDDAFVSEPIDETWYLSDYRKLGNATTGLQPLQWSWLQWFNGDMPPLWTGPLTPEAYVITSANVTLTYVPEVASVSTMNRPQFTMWFGAEGSIIEHGFQAGPEVWTGPETVTFPVDSLPVGGLEIWPGEQVHLHVGAYYPDLPELANTQIDLANSFVEFQGHTVQVGNLTGISTDMKPLELLGGRCVADLNPTGAAMGSVTFDVAANATSVTFRVDTVTSTGLGQDMDFFVLDAAGTRISYASGPSSPETLHIRGSNLAHAEPGTWTVTAYNCQPQQSVLLVSMFQLMG